VNDQDARPTSDSGISRDNLINGNVIDGAGVEFVDAPGIMVGYAQNTDIENNDISNTAWAGIALGWGWGQRDQWIVFDPTFNQYVDMGSFTGLDGALPALWSINTTPTIMGGNEIVGNTISNFLQKGWDGGAVYTTGFQDGNYLADGGLDGTLIADNVAYDKTSKSGGNVFYTDGGSRFLEIANNVLFGNPTGVINFGAPFAASDGLNANDPFQGLAGLSIPYGSDIGGCFTYGDIFYLENRWENLWLFNPFSQNPTGFPFNPLYFDPGRHGTTSNPLRDDAALPGAPYPTDLSLVGNTEIADTGSLPGQSPTAQLEALYIGWFGRAAGEAEFQTNMEAVLTGILGGASLTDAMLSVSENFATSPEDAPYAPLAALTPPISSPTPEDIALTNQFIDQTYSNLFGRAATTAEEDSWRSLFFSGGTPFSALVYEIAETAGASDIVAENSKIDAASYFTTAVGQTLFAPSLGEMQSAVSGVVDRTTELASQVVTDALVSATHTQISYDSILSPGTFITGVRADLDSAVILTGNEVTSGADTQAILFQGPLDDTALGTVYLFTPTFNDETVETSTFYGPDTSIFDPALGSGNVRAVGSYQYTESPAGVINHGMLYQGPLNGSGTWTQIDVPSDGTDVVGDIVLSAPVEDTILHSTQGDLIVGNYDLQGPGGTLIGANGVIYNIDTQQFTLMQINGSLDNLTSLYGIWQNGVGSTSYTITGGTRDQHGLNAGFLEDYDSSTGVFSNLTYYHAFDEPNLVTHFENITAVPGGFDLVATTDSGPAFAFVPVNPDGSFGSATWVPVGLPGSDLLTGNIAYQNIIGGIYNTSASSGGVASYLGTVDLSFVDSSSGLIMPVGSHNFVYATTVIASFGDLISGSTSAGNMLGGSIGNDIIVGTLNPSAADTIFTGGGADAIALAVGHTASDRIELYAANGLNDVANLFAGGVAPSVSASIVDASDVPQLGWWGQATAQFGGPVSDANTNAGIGTGTSQDMSVVTNFGSGDTIDIALDTFSELLRDLGNGHAPTLGRAIFSDVVSTGGTISEVDADVLRIGGEFANASAVASALRADPITFAGVQSGTFNHYIIAYQDLGGDVRIADMDIQLGSAASFDTTAGGATLSISDMLVLSGVSLGSLQESNITFLQGGGLDVASGQTLTISSGQTSSGLDVQSDGTLFVAGGGVAIDTQILSGGQENVLSGGLDSGALISGLLTVSSGGVSTSATVSSGGTEIVAAGGSGAGTVIAGGTLEFNHGASFDGSINFSGTGGTLRIDGTAMPSNTISDFVAGDAIDLAGVSLFRGGSVILSGSNVLVVSAHNSAYQLQLDPSEDYSSTSFRLLSDGHGGTEVEAASGLSINLTYDDSVASAPHGFVIAAGEAVSVFEGLFSNPDTVNMQIGWGEVSGGPIKPTNLGQSYWYLNSYSYDQITSALSAGPHTAAQLEALSHLPAVTPDSGTLWLTVAQQQALGLQPNNGMTVAQTGAIGFNSNTSWSFASGTTPPADKFYFIGLAEHEISEVLGRNSLLASNINSSPSYGLMDFYRYASSGVFQTTPGNPAYFSIDGGQTNLNFWNNHVSGTPGDLGDWAPSAGNDSFLDISDPGVINPLTPVDRLNMNVIGWNLALTSVVSSGETLTVSSGVTTSDVDVQSGGIVLVEDGGIAYGTILSAGASQTVSGGGEASATVLSGGDETVLSGGVVTHTAKLVMLGSYVVGNFHSASDGHGGTRITDPPVSSGSLAAAVAS
jgi:autotransporter passenger strand-loop-strand repeat protein